MPFDLDDALIKTSGASLLGIGAFCIGTPGLANKFYFEDNSHAPKPFLRAAGTIAATYGASTLIPEDGDKKKRLVIHGIGWLAAGAALLADSQKKEGRAVHNDALRLGLFANHVALGGLLLTRGLLRDK